MNKTDNLSRPKESSVVDLSDSSRVLPVSTNLLEGGKLFLKQLKDHNKKRVQFTIYNSN